MKKLVLVDGNALLHRAFHATPPLTTSQGELVNAAFGFTSMLLRGIQELKPDYIAIAWDMRSPTFRHQAYNQYKATRTPMDESLSGQYTRVHQITEALNIPEFMLSGYEADDLIATLSKQSSKEKNLETVVITGDRDIMQLISSKTKVLMPKKTLSDIGLFGVEEFVAKYGFEPKQLVDYKALAGDASDNIPGVQGIGDVTATKLIQKFSSIEAIYNPQNLKTLPQRTQTLLAEGAESAAMSKELATLDTNAPIKLDLPSCVVHSYDQSRAKSLFEELEFRSLILRLPNGSCDANSNSNSSTVVEKPKQNSSTTHLDEEVQLVLNKMSEHGVLIDAKLLENLSATFGKRLQDLEKGIYSSIGHDFNINSPKQISEILFDELNLPVVRKTKTGRSTDEATLNELKDAHPCIPLLLEYRVLFKLCSTYIDALPKYMDKDHRVHSTFNVEGAATGRLSSQDPNLQNIPIKGDLGGEIRKAFIAPKGKVLLSADYSQIELRILAHLCDDPNLIKFFQEGTDIHAATASKIFKVPHSEVTKGQRMVGKTMNFATLYGQGPHALSQQLGVDYQTARSYIEEYFSEFPKVKAWSAKVLVEAADKGYVQTIWGRRRYIPELKSSHRMFRAAGERAAVNAPIQGTQADMIKKAMIEIDKVLPSDCYLILQIHDELLFEVPPKKLKEMAIVIKEKMENSLVLKVPVVVELKSGPNWGQMENLNLGDS